MLPSMLHFLSGPIASGIWILQIAMIIHVVRTGRPYWWIWVLFLLPSGLGAIVYLAVEVLPNLSRGHGGSGWKPRSFRIRDLRRDLEDTDIVKTRFALAEELLASGKAEEARLVAEASLQGVFKDDPHTLATVAHFRLEAGKPKEALLALERVNTERDRMLDLRAAVLRGRALVATGQQSEAQILLRSLLSRHQGEEVRYFLALSLQQSKQPDEAKAIFEDIRKKFRRAGRGWRRMERHWFDEAGARLKEMSSRV